MKSEIEELNKHYNESSSNYDLEGEGHLEYYRDKFPKNYSKLSEYNS